MLTLPNQLSCEMVERKYIYFPKSSDHNAQFCLNHSGTDWSTLCGGDEARVIL